MKVNSSPESFMIRDKDYSIVSCSPETLIDKKVIIYLQNQ
jgi:anthranilate/para-aminobenzoate synthase component I